MIKLEWNITQISTNLVGIHSIWTGMLSLKRGQKTHFLNFVYPQKNISYFKGGIHRVK